MGEDGRLRLVSKSEHYHAPVGHSFPGYGLLEHARRLGIPNATHNNTRGHVTRLLEEELVRVANGLPAGADPARAAALNRVLNLETGSLACEAALKMMLGRFYRAQADSPAPKYAGRVPVFVVLGNAEGGLQANYHGTTLLAQALRGMWPDVRRAGERGGAFRVVAVRPNRLDDVEAAFARWDRRPYKVAGFLHELVMMNYGALVLEPGPLRRIYALCRRHDVPVLCDEIQSCLWAPQGFLFREYGIRPDFVAAGKGFPGGEYPASRLVFRARYDCLPQFGALVTNGQEELASLAYLITWRWAAANAERTAAVGERFAARLQELAARFPEHIVRVTGWRHLQGVHFRNVAGAQALASRLQAGGLDISVQAYKTEVPPVALLKLPLIADGRIVDTVAERIGAALAASCVTVRA
jgi:4-aminobutyrate aminotransferase-like enzyme